MLYASYCNDMERLAAAKRYETARQLTILTLQKARVEMAISLHPEIFSGEKTAKAEISPHVLMRYYREVTGKYIKLLAETRSLILGLSLQS